MDEFLTFVVIVVALVLCFFIGKEFARIAAMKGHTERRYFWWTFFAGTVGMAMVIALPDRGTAAKNENDELPDI